MRYYFKKKKKKKRKIYGINQKRLFNFFPTTQFFTFSKGVFDQYFLKKSKTPHLTFCQVKLKNSFFQKRQVLKKQL